MIWSRASFLVAQEGHNWRLHHGIERIGLFSPLPYVRSKRSMSFHATSSETFAGYTYLYVSQS